MINLFIANTDNSWFDFLSAEGNLAEVNFGRRASWGSRRSNQASFSSFA